MLKIKTFFCLLMISSACFAQLPERPVTIKDIFMSNSDAVLEQAIYKASLKHAIYSYNVANSTTPGFKPILFPEDQLELSQMVLENQDHFEKVVLEHMTASMARNRNLYSGYLALYKKKFEIYKQVATMGKK